MSDLLVERLERLSRLKAMRGSMFVAAEDGLPVAQLLMEGVNDRALAAFASSLSRKVGGAAAAIGAGRVRFLELQAEKGTLLIAVGPGDLIVAVVADRHVNAGLARLEMMRALEAVSA